MIGSSGPAGDPYPYFFLSKVCFLIFWVVVAVSYIDASDGETRIRRGGLVRLAEDPGQFKGALVLNYGLLGIGALIGSMAGAAGGIAVQRTNRSSKP